MLLSEIRSSPTSDQTWLNSIQSVVDKFGLKKFSGNNAVVVTSDDRNYAYRLWVNDVGYEKWLDIALKLQDNPHIIKVLSRTRTLPTKFKGLPRDLNLKFVKLEKLLPISDPATRDLVITADMILAGLNPAEREEYDVDTLIETVMADLERDEEHPEIRKAAEANRSFLKTLLELSRKGFNDFYIDNVMQRGDTLVITDPLADNGNIEHVRI